jgi:hypothetical protein
VRHDTEWAGAGLRGRLWTVVVSMVCLSAFSDDVCEMALLRRQILETREPPLTRLDIQTTLNVADFGAVPNDGQNDYPAFAAALKKARTLPAPVQIVFSPGVYHFASDIEPAIYNDGAFQLVNASDLLIEGNGAEILITRPHMSFVYARNSTNLIVRNFTVDYDPLPFSQGTVGSLDRADGSFILALDEGYPDPTEEPFTSEAFAAFYSASWGVVMDPSGSGRLKTGYPDHFLIAGREKLDGRKIRFFLKNKKSAEILQEGDRFVLNFRAGAMARVFDTENITLQNVTAHAIPGCFVQGANLSKVNLLGCKALRKDDRLIVAGADGIHIQSGRVGPWVENCEFEGLLDDYVNIYNIPNYILEQPEPDRVKVSLQDRVRTGDRLLFFNPRQGTVIKIVTALSVDKSGVRLSEPVKGLQIRPEDGTVFKPPVGSGADHGWKEMDHIYNLDTSCDYFVFRNNHFHDGRRHGFAIKASYGLIESNRIERLSGTALAVYNLANHPEGLWSRNLVIDGNRIEECGDSTYLIPVRILGFRWGWKPLLTPFHQTVFFTNNRISGPRLPLVELASIKDMEMRGNTFVSPAESGPFITVSGSENVQFSDNFFTASGKTKKGADAIQKTPDCKDIQIR